MEIGAIEEGGFGQVVHVGKALHFGVRALKSDPQPMCKSSAQAKLWTGRKTA
jgi:hypothetical protein